jgi:hypothetical protein
MENESLDCGYNMPVSNLPFEVFCIKSDSERYTEVCTGQRM